MTTKTATHPKLVNLTILALLASLVLSACNHTAVPDNVETNKSSAPPLASPDPDFESWTLTEALLVIHVGKSGPLARVGHNHLISTSDLDGRAQITENGALRATVRVQAVDLIVDSQALRASYQQQDGGQSRWAKAYLSVPSEKNIAETLANMLGNRVLDAQNYPEIIVNVDVPDAAAEFNAASEGSLNINLELGIKDAVAKASAVLHWQSNLSPDVAWHCRFEITHTALGMKPFSALGGALSVAESLVIDVSGVLSRV